MVLSSRGANNWITVRSCGNYSDFQIWLINIWISPKLSSVTFYNEMRFKRRNQFVASSQHIFHWRQPVFRVVKEPFVHSRLQWNLELLHHRIINSDVYGFTATWHGDDSHAAKWIVTTLLHRGSFSPLCHQPQKHFTCKHATGNQFQPHIGQHWRSVRFD